MPDGDNHGGAVMLPSGCGVRVVSVVLLIWILSRNPNLAAHYLLRRSTFAFSSDGVLPSNKCIALVFFDWWRHAAVRSVVENAIDDPNHRTRIAADEFLVRSLVAEFVFQQNVVGRSVQPGAVIGRYIEVWAHRPIPEAVQHKLVKLTYDSTSRSHFLRLMRDEWTMSPGPLSPERSLSEDDTCCSVRTPHAYYFVIRVGRTWFQVSIWSDVLGSTT